MLYNQQWKYVAPNPVSDVLLKAADLLEKHGHTKQIRKDIDGSMCLLGALEMAQEGSPVSYFGDTELTLLASNAIATTLGLSRYSGDFRVMDDRGIVAKWNNMPERTGPEVVKVMRAAAEAISLKQQIEA